VGVRVGVGAATGVGVGVGAATGVGVGVGVVAIGVGVEVGVGVGAGGVGGVGGRGSRFTPEPSENLQASTTAAEGESLGVGTVMLRSAKYPKVPYHGVTATSVKRGSPSRSSSPHSSAAGGQVISPASR
tara:strand:- start:1385 stop:1771 length:387 start_codon:yes stop_codon:yes gene_type:complete